MKNDENGININVSKSISVEQFIKPTPIHTSWPNPLPCHTSWVDLLYYYDSISVI